jgi:hypothetical protein
MAIASTAPLIAVTVALCCVGCGSGGEDGSAVEGGRSSAPPYKGPLNAPAAVDALECDGKRPFFRATGSYDSGLETVQPSAADAFDDYVDASGIGYRAPVTGYRIERAQAHRALISYDVGDRTKVAVVLADGIRDWNGDVGWGVLAWAVCDPAEFPDAVTDELNVGVWQDASGRRVPVTRVRSFQGAEHCSWTDITFLLIGPDVRRADWYVRDTSGELADHLRGEFDSAARLPDDATFTGWSRHGRQLWIGPDKRAAYLVDSDDPRLVERWPASTEPILCA